jgi:hypothetical protein
VKYASRRRRTRSVQGPDTALVPNELPVVVPAGLSTVVLVGIFDPLRGAPYWRVSSGFHAHSGTGRQEEEVSILSVY